MEGTPEDFNEAVEVGRERTSLAGTPKTRTRIGGGRTLMLRQRCLRNSTQVYKSAHEEAMLLMLLLERHAFAEFVTSN